MADQRDSGNVIVTMHGADGSVTNVGYDSDCIELPDHYINANGEVYEVDKPSSYALSAFIGLVGGIMLGKVISLFADIEN